jgi:hypothetical protein
MPKDALRTVLDGLCKLASSNPEAKRLIEDWCRERVPTPPRAASDGGGRKPPHRRGYENPSADGPEARDSCGSSHGTSPGRPGPSPRRRSVLLDTATFARARDALFRATRRHATEFREPTFHLCQWIGSRTIELADNRGILGHVFIYRDGRMHCELTTCD